MSENTTFDISIIQRPFKTNDGEEVVRDCLELEIQKVNLELILDPGVSTELHRQAIETFIEKLNSFDNIAITDFSKENNNLIDNKDESNV